MINIRKHSIKVDPPKPTGPVDERPRNKNIYLKIVSKKFLPTTQIFKFSDQSFTIRLC